MIHYSDKPVGIAKLYELNILYAQLIASKTISIAGDYIRKGRGY